MANDEPQNIGQAATRVTDSLVQGLKGNPGILGVIILNVVILAIFGWIVYNRQVRTHELVRTIIQSCLPKSQSMLQWPIPGVDDAH